MTTKTDNTPTDIEILSLAYDVGSLPEQMTDEGLCRFARVLLSRYGKIAASVEPTRCEDCPPVGYPTDKTRCAPCDRCAAPVGQEPVAWFTEDHLTDKSATTWDATVAERWRAKGWPVDPLYAAPVAASAEPWYGHKYKEYPGGVWKCADGCGPELHEHAPVAARPSVPLYPTDKWVHAFFGKPDETGFYYFRGDFGNVASRYQEAMLTAAPTSPADKHPDVPAENLVHIRALADLWMSQAKNYPDSPEGVSAAAAVRLCARELIQIIEAVSPTQPADGQALQPTWVGFDLCSDVAQAIRNAALDEAAQHCESGSGLRGTGAWTALTAAANGIRALKSQQDAAMQQEGQP